MIIKDLLIIFSVLQRVHPVVSWRYADFSQFSRLHMKGYVKARSGIHDAYCKHLGCATQVGKAQGVGVIHPDHIIAVGVGCGPGTATTQYAHPVQGPGFIHIKYRPVYGHLLGSGSQGKEDGQGKEKRFSEICVKTDQKS